jgi:uncharacterized membrane protein
MHHETAIEIAASPELIWSTLSDVKRWPEWTRSVSEVERADAGDFGVGSRVRVKQPGMPRLVWEVTEYEPRRVFSWASKVPGCHHYRRSPLDSRPEQPWERGRCPG